MNDRAKRIALSAVIFIVVWDILDVIFAMVITRSPFQFSIVRNIVYPAAISVLFDLVFNRVSNRSKRN